MGDITSLWSDEDFTEAVAALRKANTDIDNSLNAMETRVEALMADWIAGSRQQYYSHKAQWDAAILRMNDILTTGAAPTVSRIHDAKFGLERAMTNQWA